MDVQMVNVQPANPILVTNAMTMMSTGMILAVKNKKRKKNVLMDVLEGSV